MVPPTRDLLNDISVSKQFIFNDNSCKILHKYYPLLTLGRSRNRWSLDRTSGVLLHSLHVGLISSMALINFPHLSHWSPLASSYIQSGHVPSTKRSAKNLKKKEHKTIQHHHKHCYSILIIYFTLTCSSWLALIKTTCTFRKVSM